MKRGRVGWGAVATVGCGAVIGDGWGASLAKCMHVPQNFRQWNSWVYQSLEATNLLRKILCENADPRTDTHINTRAHRRRAKSWGLTPESGAK